ncbi:MAG: magnesium transporter CorA family protein [Ruminiclostridium sp.]|nr:magnesium transporter CorA family protein [Ruminiclostridium sp.]
MLQIYKTVNDELKPVEKFEDGVWANLVNPSEEEIIKVCSEMEVDPEYFRAALDEEERARIEHENGQFLIIVDVPVIDKDGINNLYSTIPMGIILLKDAIITVCLRENTIIKDFEKKRIKSFYTYYKTRFVFQLLYKNAAQYLQYLKYIDKASSRIEKDLHKSMKNKELIQLLKLEKSLVYFSTSLKANEIVLEKLLKHEAVKKYPDDTDLLEDVIIENKQAIEMANIYSSILTGIMGAYASVISNNVSIVMKFLASITIVMAIPTMVASFFGMNVLIPFKLADYPHAFAVVMGVAAALSIISAIILAKRKMF